MKRIEAWHTLHEMWNDATPEQKEALGIAMDDIEFVDLIRGHGVPLTNAQHIRSLSDEELAYLLRDYYCEGHADGLHHIYGAMPISDVREWLKQPYKEDT